MQHPPPPYPPNLRKWNEGVRSREFSEKGEGASGNCQISSNENEVIKTILSKRGFFFFFFCKKDIARTKTLTSKD